MFEGTYSPPFYLDLYNFKDGPQDDIFVDSYTYIPTPGPTQTEVPTPVNHTVSQPSADRNSIGRTVRELSALNHLLMALFSIVALCASGTL